MDITSSLTEFTASGITATFTSIFYIEGVIYHRFIIKSEDSKISWDLEDRFSHIRDFYLRLKKMVAQGTLLSDKVGRKNI